MNTTQKVVTRFAPSPTGYLHIGNYRTAVFSYIFAKQNGGEFILRIEDTDRERSKKEYEENIIESLAWLALPYDRFYRQREQLETHKKYLKQLLDQDLAYVSKEAAKDGSGAIKEIVRFRNPNKVVTFHDLIRGPISIDTTDLGDFVIARNIEEPLFHFAVVIDDFTEGVTHVIRGEDHISNTPRQILILESLGVTPPQYAHLPLVLSPDRTKLSKRKGALALTEYRDQGYLPGALVNCMAFIGWNPGTEEEILSLQEVVSKFDITKIQKSGAIFNVEKLDWFNREYIKRLDEKNFLDHAAMFLPEWIGEKQENLEILKKIEQLIRDRIVKFSDVKVLFDAGEFDYFFKEPTSSNASMLVWKGLKDDPEGIAKTHEYLREIGLRLERLANDPWNYATIKSALSDLCEKEGNGNVLWPLRVALSGREKSPDPFEIAAILGKEKTLSRLQRIIQK